MPTWWFDGPEEPKNTRSPGCRSLIGTCGKLRYCDCEPCDIETPPCAHAIIVSPEQSKLSGPAPAYWYGLPICARAYATAAEAPPLGAGIEPGSTPVSAEDALDEPPLFDTR